MPKKKVAIVLDNCLEVSKKLVSEIGDKHDGADVVIFDFSEFNPLEFNIYKLAKLIYKIEDLDLAEFDLVYSISTGFANGIVTNLDTEHRSIFVSWPNWYFETSWTFLKLKLRMWLNVALDRPEKSYSIFNGLSQIINRVNPKVKLDNLSSKVEFKTLKLSSESSQKQYVLFIEYKSNFLNEVARIFNQTGKKVVIVGPKWLRVKCDFLSEFVEFVDKNEELQLANLCKSAKGILFDQYCMDVEFVNRVLSVAVPVLSYRNMFMNQVFMPDWVYELNEIDSFENEFAKFVSWAKTDKKAEFKILDFTTFKSEELNI
jgi:hypothetical protein